MLQVRQREKLTISNEHKIKSPRGTENPAHYTLELPWWRKPLIGYLAVLPILGMTLLCTHLIGITVKDFAFPTSAWVLALTVVALLWSLGPTLVFMLLGLLGLEMFFIHPGQIGSFFPPENVVQLLPYFIAGTSIALVTEQLRRSRIQAQQAKFFLQHYASELETTNHKLIATNQQLDEANETKNRFLSMVSHELKTPVTCIRGYAQLLQRRLERKSASELKPEQVLTTLQGVDSQAGRLTNLINELLDIGRLQNGKFKLHKQLCDVNELTSKVVADQRLITRRDIHLETASSQVLLLADADRLTQVLTNLISNAAKYSPESEAIDVAVKTEDAHVLISVRDRGKGMTPDQQKHIFDSFYRTPDAQSSSVQGLGLGLAIARDIVEHHEGKIWCESQVDEGSTFFVQLLLTA